MRESGLLELYVIGDLSPEEISTVETFIQENPAVKAEIFEIEKAFNLYAKAHSINPSPSTKTTLFEEIRKNNPISPQPGDLKQGNSSLLWKLLALALAIGLAAAFYWASKSANDLAIKDKDYQVLADSCETIQSRQGDLLLQYESMLNQNTSILPLTPTEKYPETNITLFADNTNQSNFLKLDNLPPLQANQSYQLWSLKGTDAPIPLDVFQGDSLIIPIAYENGTNVYAITIEPLGGSQSPNLDNLIGTVAI